MQRYFITAEATYESLRQLMDAQLKYPNALGQSVFQTPLQAPRDAFRRILLAVDVEIAGYATIAAAIANLLDSDAMEEIDEATYLAAVASAASGGGASSWDDLTGKPSSFAPSAHSASHATGGSDALTAASIGAAATSHSHAWSDITSGVPSTFTPSSHASSHQIGGSDVIGNVVNSPSQITGTQNDYSLPSADVVRLTSDAARTITGFVAGTTGRVVVLVNVGSFAITLSHQSTSSTAANRVIVPWSADYILDPAYAAVLVYDGTTSRWRIV